ncbi:zinc ABC transporter substrate-binding protein AztC [Microbacterium sp. ZXX196]|uniref:zinc ABC transporter substrate-binding protein AztC n=1 Tax=Microbacterium sp. ZXX196 TaxID=2609291 RepID=UPI0012B76FD3|nr:zinc ABC transporter substrate-binding protein AztC [Microbacterium sp. ZXX196]MTE24441.1 zinc ABC transporter substrate-binding protein [Microbacterium sp. ZXX196]
MTGRGIRRAAAIVAGALALPAALAGCGAAAAGDDPQIQVTTNILGDVGTRIAGDEATVTTLMKPNADPHSFEISAQEASRLHDADLVVSNGLGLEEGVEQHLVAAAEAGAHRFVAGDHIEVVAYSSEDAQGPDPHFWTDPARMVDVVDALEEEVAALDGIDPAAIADNADAYRAELADLDDEMSAAFSAIPAEARQLVTNHHVFGYLAERFDFTVVGAAVPGGTTLASPSAADLADLAGAIEEAGVATIFADSSQPERLIEVLASEAGIDVGVTPLFTESLAEPGETGDTYLSMMRANTERIAHGLAP